MLEPPRPLEAKVAIPGENQKAQHVLVYGLRHKKELLCLLEAQIGEMQHAQRFLVHDPAAWNIFVLAPGRQSASSGEVQQAQHVLH